MKPNYTNLSSKFYGVGKVQTYNHRVAFQDTTFPQPPPPLVPQPPRVVSLQSEMDATSQVGQEVRDAIKDNLKTLLVEIDVDLNRPRA